MTSFSSLSELARSFLAFWAFLLCLINIANIVLAFNKRKYLFGIGGGLSFILAFILWQIIFDYSLLNKNGECSNFTHVMVELNWLYWLLMLLAISVISIILFIYNVYYEKNYLTTNSIKIHLDKIDCGICCYKDNGRILFANIYMNHLYASLTGETLLNGHQLNEYIKDDLVSLNDEKWKFSIRNIVINNENVYEVIATNVTNEYNKTQILEKNKKDLSRIKKELQEYNLNIDEVVRRKEILQAKINIHDEMNRLMLSSVAIESNNIEELDNIFSLWQENALLLSKGVETNLDEENIKRIRQLAKSLKIKLMWDDKLISSFTSEQKSIFYQCAQEAIANASKHANADKMIINIKSNDSHILCEFINNGLIKQKEITYSGGLANLEKLTKKHHASIKTKIDDEQFVLILSLFIEK